MSWLLYVGISVGGMRPLCLNVPLPKRIIEIIFNRVNTIDKLIG